MFLLVRAVVHVGLFVGLIFVWVPRTILETAGTGTPSAFGVLEVAGIVVAAAGAILAALGMLVLTTVGGGTIAPFDPPRDLVVTGPFRLVRNPIYLGGSVALFGASLFFRSAELLVYATFFFLLCHLVVKGFEEPGLRRRFPHRYPVYYLKAARWRIPLTALFSRRSRTAEDVAFRA